MRITEIPLFQKQKRDKYGINLGILPFHSPYLDQKQTGRNKLLKVTTATFMDFIKKIIK